MPIRSFKSIVANAVAILCIATVGVAQADTVVVNLDPNSNVHSFFDIGASTPAAQGPHYMKGFLATVTGNADPLLNGTFYAFCFEPLQVLSHAGEVIPGDPTSGTGDSSYTTSFSTAPLITPLVQRLFDLGYLNSRMGGDAAAAFNVALQELLFETSGSYSLDDGSYVRTASGAYDIAARNAGSALLSSILAASDQDSHVRIMQSVSPTSQDLMMAFPALTNSVPEPASAALMLGALGAMAAAARRRRRG